MRPRSLAPPLKQDRHGYAYVEHASIPNTSHRKSLGRFGTPESAERYANFLEGLRAGAEIVEISVGTHDQASIRELVAAWESWADHNLVRNGKPTAAAEHMRAALPWLTAIYGDQLVMTFGSKKLLHLRDQMAASGRYNRSTVNAHLGRLKRFWKWAAARELCRADLHLILDVVPGLRIGESAAPESEEVDPACMDAMAAVLPYCPPVIAEMIQVQFYCGMRPAEVCQLHRDGLFEVGGSWLYQPAAHKTSWRGKKLIKAVPKAAYRLIEPRLDATTGYVFDPETARAWGREQAALSRGERKTKRFPCEEKRVQAKKSDRRCSGFYSTGGYRTAVDRSVQRAVLAGVDLIRFTPN